MSATVTSSASYSIEMAEATDADQINRLLQVLAEATGDKAHYRGSADALRRFGFGSSHRHFSALLARPQGSPALTDSAGPDAVGTCVFLPDFSTWRGRPGVYILDLVVEPEWRGSGLGLDLLAAAARHGRRQWDADYLILSVARANAGAIRFYRRHGFEADEHVDVMVLNGLDGVMGSANDRQPPRR